MTRLKDATFEAGSITGTDAFTSSTGSPTVDTTSKVKGVNSARTNWASATNVNGTVSGLSAGELWISFYMYIGALPTTGAPRVVTTSNGNTQFNMTLNSSGVLAARANTTSLGTVTTLSINTKYRIGLHLKTSTASGNSDAIYEIYVALDTAAFSGTPNLTTSTVLMNVNNNAFSSFVVGMNNGVATTGDIYWDNIRIDNASMPTDDVAGGTDTPKTVTVSVTSTLTFGPKAVDKPLTYAVTSTSTVMRVVSFIRALVATITATASKAKPILVTLAVNSAAVIQKTIGKPIVIAITSTITFTKGLVNIKLITYAVTSTVTFAKGIVNLKIVTLAVTSTVPTALKNVGKPIIRTVTTTLTRITNIPHTVLVSVTPILFLKKDFAFTKVRTVTSTLTAIVGKGYFKIITQVVTISSVIQKNILKPIVMTQTVVALVGPKAIAKTITRLITVTVANITDRSKTIQYITTVSVIKNVSIGKVFIVVQDTTVTILRSFTLLIERIVVASTLPSVQRNIQFTRTVIVNLSETFSKLLSDAFTNIYLRTNVRSLTLTTKNIALQALSRNARTIDLKDTNES